MEIPFPFYQWVLPSLVVLWPYIHPRLIDLDWAIDTRKLYWSCMLKYECSIAIAYCLVNNYINSCPSPSIFIPVMSAQFAVVIYVTHHVMLLVLSFSVETLEHDWFSYHHLSGMPVWKIFYPLYLTSMEVHCLFYQLSQWSHMASHSP